METDILSPLTQWFLNNQGFFFVYGVNIISALLTLIFGIYNACIISRTPLRLRNKRKVDPTVASFSANMVKYLVLSFVIIAALGQIGVQTAPFVAVVGTTGLAIGLALQGSLSNFAAPGFELSENRAVHLSIPTHDYQPLPIHHNHQGDLWYKSWH